MAYIPKGSRWYVAELIQELTIEGDPRNVVHKNLVLVEAASPEMAYKSALQLGENSEISYPNPLGKLVTIRFRGLGHLDVILDELKHGAEIQYEEHVGVPTEQIKSWVRQKEEPSVFRDIEPSSAPDYSSKEILNEVEQLLAEKKREQG